MYNFFTDGGPDYSCSKCGGDTLGEITHECEEEEEECQENMKR